VIIIPPISLFYFIGALQIFETEHNPIEKIFEFSLEIETIRARLPFLFVQEHDSENQIMEC
jgi:hypothetical protein